MKNNAKKVSMAGVMAVLAALGYGGYTVVKEKDLEALRRGEVATYRVERVIDGDTFEIEDTSAGSVQVRDVVRMQGIDAPEEGECYFNESKAALEKLILKKKVELRKDVTNMDDFGRLLRYVLLENEENPSTNVLAEGYMVENGYAEPVSHPLDRMHYSYLVERREEAMKEKKGMWGECEMTPAEHAQKDVPAPSASCTIKGNISTGEFGKTYFLKGCNNYAQVKIDPDRGRNISARNLMPKKLALRNR